MAIDIENPGSDEQALKSAFSGLAGQALVAQGEITSDVDFVDIDLPVEYSYFTLVFERFALDDLGQIGYRFSSDGGTTFNEDSDGYSFNSMRSTTSATFVGTGGPDWVAVFASVATATLDAGADGELKIYPGDTDKCATTRAFAQSRGVAGTGSQFDLSSGHFKNLGRQNAIRIIPYDVGSTKLTAGRYKLFGSIL